MGIRQIQWVVAWGVLAWVGVDGLLIYDGVHMFKFYHQLCNPELAPASYEFSANVTLMDVSTCEDVGDGEWKNKFWIYNLGKKKNQCPEQLEEEMGKNKAMGVILWEDSSNVGLEKLNVERFKAMNATCAWARPEFAEKVAEVVKDRGYCTITLNENGDFRYGSCEDYEFPMSKVYAMRNLLTAIPLKHYSPNASGEEESCVICLEAFKRGDTINVFPCSHIYHRECIITWLVRSPLCPVCKRDVFDDNIETTVPSRDQAREEVTPVDEESPPSPVPQPVEEVEEEQPSNTNRDRNGAQSSRGRPHRQDYVAVDLESPEGGDSREDTKRRKGNKKYTAVASDDGES